MSTFSVSLGNVVVYPMGATLSTSSIGISGKATEVGPYARESAAVADSAKGRWPHRDKESST
jgi:hypothetical protein